MQKIFNSKGGLHVRNCKKHCGVEFLQLGSFTIYKHMVSKETVDNAVQGMIISLNLGDNDLLVKFFLVEKCTHTHCINPC